MLHILIDHIIGMKKLNFHGKKPCLFGKHEFFINYLFCNNVGNFFCNLFLHFFVQKRVELHKAGKYKILNVAFLGYIFG